jgi:anaerobic selenocysteine-containing dehydrogenase
VADGQKVRIETAHGAVEVAARLRDDLVEGIVVLPHCVAEANANQLTALDERDPISGFPNLRSLPCRVRTADAV